MAGSSGIMDPGEKIYSKVSSLWPIAAVSSRDFLLQKLPLLLENNYISKFSLEKGTWKEKRVSSKNFTDADDLAKSCLIGLMRQHFTTIEDCQDVYVLCIIITGLFNGFEAEASADVKNKRNKWAHSNSGAPYWKDETVFQDIRRSVGALVKEICPHEKQEEILRRLAEVEKREYFTKEEVFNFEKERKIAHDLLRHLIDEAAEDLKGAILDSENKIKEHADGNKADLENTLSDAFKDIKAHFDEVKNDSDHTRAQIMNEITGDHNTNYGGNIVGGDLNIYPVRESAAIHNSGEAEKMVREGKLESVVEEYKKFITEDQNSTLRTKLEQLKVDGEVCFIPRTFKRGRGEDKSLTTTELLNTLSRSKTTLVSGPSGSGKSTVAASITERWAKPQDCDKDVITGYSVTLYLSSLVLTSRFPLNKLLWGEFAREIGEKEAEDTYQELKERKEKVLVIIDGIGEVLIKNKPLRVRKAGASSLVVGVIGVIGVVGFVSSSE